MQERKHKMRSKAFLLIVVTVALSLSAGTLLAAQDPQIKTTFVRVGGTTTGMLYEPATPNEKSQIAVLVMHSDRDYMDFSAGMEMSGCGYRVLCANSLALKTRFGGDIGIDGLVSHLSLAVAYLRKYPGVRKVVLLGHSGGGALMSAYQNIAENGVNACQGPEKIVKCPDRLAGLPPADGVMLIDSNWGLGAMMLFALDPAVENEGDGQKLDPSLDMYNPANGFNPEGTPVNLLIGSPVAAKDGKTQDSKPQASNSANAATGSTYSDEFISKFFSAEGKRNNQLIQTALDRLKAINAGKGNYTDDEPFNVSGGSQSAMNNKLHAQNLRLMSHTRKAWPLLRSDGSIVTQVIHSVRAPQNPKSQTGSLREGALMSTVHEFLNTFAVRTTDDYGYDEDSVNGIDWSSSYSNPPGTIKGVSAPLLVMGMTGSFEYLASETIYENAKSADKTLAFVEGADHTYDTCKQCEKYPGQFGDTKKTTYDYVDKWLSQKGRFIDGGKP